MEVRFLRPELERLHARTQEAFAMMSTEIGLEVFGYALDYATSGSDMFSEEGLYLDALLPYLAEHVPTPASILDVGGGTGRAAIPLARAGYDVTMLEPAASGLRLAHEKAQAAGVAERLSYVCGYAVDAAVLGERAFDAVLGLQSLVYEKDLRSTLAVLLRVSRKVLCFDAYSRYGFLAGRMPGGYAYAAGYTPATMLHVLTEHRTPGEKTLDTPDPLPLYTSDEIAQIARQAGLQVDKVVPVSYREVFEWQNGSDQTTVAELDRLMREDRVLKELAACHLVLGRKMDQSRQSGAAAR